MGEFVDTAADNLRGQGADDPRHRHQAVADAVRAWRPQRRFFGTFKNLSTLVSALHDSTDLLEQLNRNLAAVTALLADDPNKVGQTVRI